MGRTVYVNGAWLPEDEAKISVFDRGFLFADAVYEVTSVLESRLVDFAGHVARLHRSTKALGLGIPVADEALLDIHREIIAQNDLREGMIYLQVSRGAADRDFAFPADPSPSLVLFTQAKPLIDTAGARNGIKVITTPDIRWARRDIKTVQLLSASLAKMAAKDAGKDDAWFVEDGVVTEGSSSNAYIVTQDGTIVTRELSPALLPGITRAAVLRLAAEAQLRVEERPFTPDEAKTAAEAFVTAASAFVLPVVEIDGQPIGTGTPGPISRRLREIYVEDAMATAI